MTLKVLYVTVYCELVSKYYGTVCGKVETIIQTETLAPLSAVFPLVIIGLSPVHNDRITRCRRPYMELCKHFMTVELVN